MLNGIGGIGKSSFAAQFPDPIFIQSRGESGLQTLESAGIASAAIMPFDLPNGDTSLEAQTYQDVLDAVDFLATSEHGYKTLVIDVMNGVEKLIFEHCMWRDFDRDPIKFDAYGKGADRSVSYVRDLCNALDRPRTLNGMTIVLLCHTKIKPFNNPLGDNYDRYVPDMHDKSWSVIYGWADIVLFANRMVSVHKDNARAAKGKAVDLGDRTLFTECGAAWDAKNRHNLPPEIPMGSSAQEAYANFVSAMKESVISNKETK